MVYSLWIRTRESVGIMIKLNRFESVSGTYIEEILGQSRIGYSMSEATDFYDMVELSKKGGYRGSIILFYDYDNGRIYQPFKKQKNVLYGKPVYLKKCFWFLQGDYNAGKITLFRYLPDEAPEMIAQLSTAEVNPYNLQIIGEDVHIISEDDDFACYYPEKFCFPKDSKESITMIADGKVYFSAWVEEGWDEEKNCASEEYRYYTKVIVRNFSGAVLSEELGAFNQRPDGKWWMS